MSVRVLLKDIASFSKGEQINGEDLIEDGTYPYLNGGIQPSGRWSDCNTPGNTITISEGGNSCGYVNLMTEPFWCGAHCYYLFDLSVDVQYLYFAIKSQQARLMGIRSGACMPNIKKNDLGCFELTIHTEDAEQKHIVEQLLLCQTVIEQRQRQLRALDTLIKARFVEMFGDMILNPNGWEVYQLGQVCDVRDGTHDSPQYYKNGFPLVTSKNVTAGKIDISDCNLISEEDYKRINQRSKVDLGDIIMPMIGTVGKPVIVDIEPRFAIKNVALIKFIPESKVLNSFVKALLESDYFDTAVMDKVRGGTQKFISLGDIRKLEICLPSLEIQYEFELFVKQIDTTKSIIQVALDKAQSLFDSLMQEFFG